MQIMAHIKISYLLHVNYIIAASDILQEALLSQRGCTMLRVCIASIQNVKRSLLLLVVSASDIPPRIKFCSVLFAVFVYAAGRHKHSLAGASPTVRSTLHGRR